MSRFGCALDGAVVRCPARIADLADATHAGVLWRGRRGRLLLDIPEVARYLVSDGQLIEVEPVPGADAAEVRRFLRMTPAAALYLQRGIPVLHASVALTWPRIRQWAGIHGFDPIESHAVEGIRRFEAFGAMAYTRLIASALLDRARYLTVAAAVAGSAIPIRRLFRPRGRWTADDLASLVDAESSECSVTGRATRHRCPRTSAGIAPS